MADLSDELFAAVVRMRIRETRLAKGLRQVDVANRLNMSERDYQRYERPSSGKRFNPTMLKLRALARALETDPGRLVMEPRTDELARLEEAYEPRVDRQE